MSYYSDSDSDSDISDSANGAGYPSSLQSPSHAIAPRVTNVCTTVMGILTGQKTESQLREDAKRLEKEEKDKVSLYMTFNIPYAWVKKPIVIKEAELFHEAYPNPLFCLAVLGRLLRLHSKGQLQLEKEEVTNLFFGLTKLFGASTIASPTDQCVRRMVYWLLNEITELSQPEERLMLLSCLTKDMTDPFTPALRARALRLLPIILIHNEPSSGCSSCAVSASNNLQKLSQTIAATKTISTTLPCSLDTNSNAVTSKVISGSLVALCRLLQNEQAAQLISSNDAQALRKQCRYLATGSGSIGRDFRMVQLHALQAVISFDHPTLVTASNGPDKGSEKEIDATSKEYRTNNDLSALVGNLIMGDAVQRAAPLTLIILIRHSEQILLQGVPEPGQQQQIGKEGTGERPRLCSTHYNFFFDAVLVNENEMVICEAARVVIHLTPNKIPVEVMEKAVAVLNRLKKSKKKKVQLVANRLLTIVGQKLVQTLF